MTKFKSKFIAAAALAMAAFTASAAPVTITGTLTRGAFEFSPNVTGNPIVDGVAIGSTNIGAMKATFDDGFDVQSFLMFCVDLYSQAGGLGTPLSYDRVNYVSELNPFDKIGKLITFNGGLASTDASGSAAMQLAIWELLYDDAPGDVTTGAFRASGVTGTDTRLKANALLAGANTVTASQYNVSFLSDNAYAANGKFGFQDYITADPLGRGCNEGDCVTPIPEPGTYALILAGLAALGFTAKRRKVS